MSPLIRQFAPCSLLRSPQVSGRISELSVGENFNGQLSTVYLLKEPISDAAQQQLMFHSAGGLDANVNPPENVPVLPHSSPVDVITKEDSFSFEKFCFVYDPVRTTAKAAHPTNLPVTALDIHSKLNLTLTPTAIPWILQGAKDVIDSIGGIQTLVPLFETLPPAFPSSEVPPNPAEADQFFLIPSLIFLLSSFLRNHFSNCATLHSISGLSVIANSLAAHGATEPMLIVRYCKPAAAQLVDALMDLRSATAALPALEDETLSLLLFNIPLWLSSPPPPAPPLPGIALHATLFPVLSAIGEEFHRLAALILAFARFSLPTLTPSIQPLMRLFSLVAVQVDAKRIASCVKPQVFLSHTMSSLPTQDCAPSSKLSADLFDRSSSSSIPPIAPPTSKESLHVTAILIGMTISIMAQSPTTEALRPYISFISKCLDEEWLEADKKLEEGGAFENVDVCERKEGSAREALYIASKSMLLGFLYMLRQSNVTPLLTSIEKVFGSPRATVAWILNACVNSYDDEIRGIGIRILTAFIQKIESPQPFGMLGEEGAASGTLKKRGGLEESKKFSIFNSVKGAVGKVGETVTAAVLTTGTAQNQVNTKLAYKLLWHWCKRHSIRLGNETHDALMDMIVVGDGTGMGGGRGSGAVRTVIEADKVLGGGFVFTDKEMYKVRRS